MSSEKIIKNCLVFCVCRKGTLAWHRLTNVSNYIFADPRLLLGNQSHSTGNEDEGAPFLDGNF